jgi:hypothetical protein
MNIGVTDIVTPNPYTGQKLGLGVFLGNQLPFWGLAPRGFGFIHKKQLPVF